jgi:CelD/BcsL family acetyltransferase involved in cellulose biosynthesis
MIAAAPVQVTVEAGAWPGLDALAAAADPVHAFLRASWFASAAGDAPLLTLCARRSASGEAIVAIPLVPRRLGPLTVHEVAGSYWPYRSFPLAADVEQGELEALLSSDEAHAVLGRAWRLGPVHVDDPTAARLIAAAKRSGWTVLSRQVATCYILDLKRLTAEGPWPGSKRRQRLRSREHRVARQGELVFSTIRDTQWNQAALDLLAAIEAETWVAREASPKDMKFVPQAPTRGIWDGIIADPQLAARLNAWILHIGGEPAAFVFALDSGGIRHVIANGYSERFTEGGPGALLLHRAFIESAETGVAQISWGAGDAGYKSEIGAEAGPETLDLLFVRGKALAAVAGPFWRR